VSLLGQHIDLVLLLVVTLAMFGSSWSGLMWGLLGGLVLDFASVVPFGTNAIILALIGFTVGSGLRRVSQAYPVLPFVAMPLVTLVYYLLVGLALTLTGWTVDWAWIIGGVLFPAVVLDTVALPFIYLPVYTLRKRKRVEISWQGG